MAKIQESGFKNVRVNLYKYNSKQFDGKSMTASSSGSDKEIDESYNALYDTMKEFEMEQMIDSTINLKDKTKRNLKYVKNVLISVKRDLEDLENAIKVFEETQSFEYKSVILFILDSSWDKEIATTLAEYSKDKETMIYSYYRDKSYYQKERYEVLGYFSQLL